MTRDEEKDARSDARYEDAPGEEPYDIERDRILYGTPKSEPVVPWTT